MVACRVFHLVCRQLIQPLLQFLFQCRGHEDGTAGGCGFGAFQDEGSGAALQLVREYLDDAAGKCSGWKQVELTDLGRERAIKLGEIQKDAGFDVIFTSDLIRAINSAKLAFPNVKHIQDKRLRECNYGDLDGQDKSLVIYEEHIEKPFPNGESLKDVERRIDDFIKFLKDNYHGKKVGIVAHRAPQLAFEVLTKNISWEEANRNDWRKAKAWQPGWEYIIK